MKGYLQRLVRQEAHRGESVRPWTGSVFSRQHEPDSELLDFEETISVESQSLPALLSQRESHLPAHHPSSPPSPPQTHAGENDVAPVTGETEDAPAHSEDTRNYSAPLLTIVNSRQLAPEQTAAPATPGRIPSPPPFTEHYQPLVKSEPSALHREDAAYQAASPATTPTQPNRAGADSRHAKKAKLTQAAAAAAQGDEIQIHIGRVEVTAVQAPAPQIAKVPDRGLSLDAYLRRRERGSR